MRQKTEIVFEIEEVVTVKCRRSFIGLCQQCNAPAEMLTTEIAARLSDFSEREIFRLLEAGEIHFIETDRVYVCRYSLTNAAV